MASCAVPILFTGPDIAGNKYHDGGIIHDLPIEPFLTDPGIHKVIIHRIPYPGGNGRKLLGIKQAFINGHHMLRDALHEHRMKLAEANGKRVILLETSHRHPGLLQSKATKKRYFEDGHRTGSTISQQLTA